MLDTKRLSRVATGKVTLLRSDRISVRHGATLVDIYATGEATYSDPEYHMDLGVVSQPRAEELVQGASVPGPSA
jgi:hypothetical protein